MCVPTAELKSIISNLYKTGRKSVNAESHCLFLNKCLELRIIPKCFRIKHEIPGDQLEIQQQLNEVSFKSIQSEINKWQNIHQESLIQYEQINELICEKFGKQKAKYEMKRFLRFSENAKYKIMKTKQHKLNILRGKDNQHIDRNFVEEQIHIEQINLSVDHFTEENDSLSIQNVQDNTSAHKNKKRRFKRRYMQPRE